MHTPAGQRCCRCHGSADFDRDGWPDLFSAQYQGNHIYLNNRDGTFRAADHALPADAADKLGDCAPADLNADGAPDLYCPHHIGPDSKYALPMALYCNRGDGTFEEMLPIDDVPEGDHAFAVDADGDGDLDLIGSNPYLWVAYQQQPYPAQQ